MKPHPYVVAPYDAIVSPLIDMDDTIVPKGLAYSMGFASLIEPSAREQLAAALATFGSMDKYINWIWGERKRPGKANKNWKPYHHGEAAPPLSKPSRAANVTNLPMGKGRTDGRSGLPSA